MRKMLRDGGYTSFTKDQLWYYHSYDYGWRRVFLDQRKEVSPIDQTGQWFNSLMVDKTEVFFLSRKNGAREVRERDRGEELRRDGRDLLNRWAEGKGYSDIDAYALAEHEGNWFSAYSVALREMTATGQAARRPARRYQSPAQALGVTAREYTPEEMEASRRQLGLDAS